MSNSLYNKIKTIENSRRDLKNVLNNKGLDTTNVEALGSLVGMVGQLEQPGYHIDPEEVWEGITRKEAPTNYYKGDDDWKNLINLEEIMTNDTTSYSAKAIFLIRVSDCPNASIVCYPTYNNSMTNVDFSGFAYCKFSDSSTVTTISANATTHTWDTSKDIVATNGERFRYIIGYSNDSSVSFSYLSSRVAFEAIYLHKGNFGRAYLFGRYNSGSGQNMYLHTTSSPKYIKSSANATVTIKSGSEEAGISYLPELRLRTCILEGNASMSGNIKSPDLEYFVYNGTSTALNPSFVDISNKQVETYIYIKYTNSLSISYSNNADVYCDRVTALNSNKQNENIRYSLNTVNASIAQEAFVNCNDIQLDMKTLGSIGTKAFVGFKHNKMKFTSINGDIGDSAFYDSCLSQDVTVLSGCTAIGHSVFVNCNVTNLDLSNSSITTIPDGCSTETDMDNTTRSYYGTFRHNDSIQSISLPESLRTISNYAFAYMKQLRQINIPFGVTSIGNNAFYGCNKLENISLPSSVISLGTQIFAECKALTTAAMPEGMPSIPDYTFEGCESLVTVSLSSHLSTLGTGLFAKCTSLQHITLPKAVTTIPQRCFYECTSLLDVTCPEGKIGTVNDYAFANCEKLSIIPDLSNTTTMGIGVFLNCKSLVPKCPTKLTTMNTDTFAGNNSFIDFSELESCNLTTIKLRGSMWHFDNVLQFLYKLPDRTGKTRYTINMGPSFAKLAWAAGSVSDATVYYNVNTETNYVQYEQSVYSYYANKYILDNGTGLEWSDSSTEGAVTVANYVAGKNWALV